MRWKQNKVNKIVLSKCHSYKLKIMKRICLIGIVLAALTAMAAPVDTLRHWGAELSVTPGRTIVMDEWQRKWQRDKNNFAIDLKLIHAYLPSDSNDYARDYGFPTLSLGAKWGLNHGVTMHKGEEFWGKTKNAINEVDYDSHMGNTISFYGQFARPLIRTSHFETDYALNFGLCWSHLKYNVIDNIDNELIGSRWNIFFGAGIHGTWHFLQDWGLRMGIDYYHYSNGALNRPNKGANFVGATIGLVYQPYYEASIPHHSTSAKKFEKYWYLNPYIGIGGRTLMEEWQMTQFSSTPDDPDYRTDSFKCYWAYSFGTDVMYRYARRWASGIGVDVFYGTYDGRVQEICQKRGDDSTISPWSVGIAAKHEAFFGPLSLNVSLGLYLYRHMGKWSKELEKQYYERVGINYRFKKLSELKIGINIKAHKTKADLTEVVISYPTTFFAKKIRKNPK